ELRPIGRAAEAAMYRATGGVNTHKGAVFCLGLLSAAAALVIAARPAAGAAAAPPSGVAGKAKLPLGDRARFLAARIARGIVDAELAQPPGPATGAASHTTAGAASRTTAGAAGVAGAKAGEAARPSAGERLYRESGVRGARGQAEDGYPLLGTRLLPLLRAARARGQSDESARIDALLASMAELEDSCLLSRGGVAGLDLARRGAAGALASGGADTAAGLDAIRRLDAELCARNLSPGGSADMLAAAIFLLDLEDRHPEA
ncbi:MAG: triphosphoribosyl-dephospho-CoA synthase, partial [Spirochaetaceae bacterium]|nr:triphosphoribosyl-dephospho-CoA synthase [Spirochaetaceae bacterium]